MAPKRGPKAAQGVPKAAQGVPKAAHRAPKAAPRSPKDGQKARKRRPKNAPKIDPLKKERSWNTLPQILLILGVKT